VPVVDADSELTEEIKEAFHTATPYVEGHGIDIDIHRHGQLEAVKHLLKIKFENLRIVNKGANPK